MRFVQRLRLSILSCEIRHRQISCKTKASNHPFNSLLRDQIGDWKEYYKQRKKPFNSLLRDQLMRQGQLNISMPPFNSLLRDQISPERGGWQLSMLLSILSCEISHGSYVGIRPYSCPFNSLLRDQKDISAQLAEAQETFNSLLRDQLRLLQKHGLLDKEHFQFSLARSVLWV